MKKESVDIAIVGGGVVGASLAYALHQSTDLKIKIIEAKSPTLENPDKKDERTIALSLASAQILKGLKLWDTLKNDIQAIETVHVSDRGHLGITRLNKKDLETEALGYVVEMQKLSQTITDSVNDLFCYAKVNDISQNEKTMTLTCENEEEKFEIEAKLLVAADGARSKVRQQLAIPTHQFDYQQDAIVGTIEISHPHENIAYERFTDQGPLALLPMQGKRVSLVWTVPRYRTKAILALSDKEFISKCQYAFGYRLGHFTKIGNRESYPLHLIYSQETVHDKTVFIGNAAQTLHPIAGQGFNLGLRDVAILAETIVDAIHLGLYFANPETLKEYAKARNKDRKRVIRVTDGLARLFLPQWVPLNMARGVGMFGMDVIKPLKRIFARHQMGLLGVPSRLASGISL